MSQIINITEKQIAEDLIKIGFRPDNSGYYYMIKAVKMRLNSLAGCFTGCYIGSVYESIAKSFNTTPSCVERAIRYSIQQICNHDSGAWKEFGWQDKDKPPNRFVIAAIAERYRLGSVS